jgi:hypothetical protein
MNTQQLEARSDLERDAVENTLGELRRRLSPGQLVDELLAYCRFVEPRRFEVSDRKIVNC